MHTSFIDHEAGSELGVNREACGRQSHGRRASTYRFCRWGSTGQARTRGPHTPSEDTRTLCRAPPRWLRSGNAHTETPETQAHGQGQTSRHPPHTNSCFPSPGTFCEDTQVLWECKQDPAQWFAECKARVLEQSWFTSESPLPTALLGATQLAWDTATPELNR